MNTDASWPSPFEAEARVLGIQTKLHRWARDDPDRRFDDLYNLVSDPAFLVVAWRRVRGNRGARSAGVDGESAYYVTAVRGEHVFLSELRAALKARSYRPTLVREAMIPKPGGKRRRLGIPTVRDRVVQAALKLVLEPIFEADFKPCSYGFRPRRRAQDAIAEIHFFCSRSYEWVLEGDIEACFDEISHSALLMRVRERVGDRRVLGLVKAFLKAGVLSEDGVERDTITGTPQGGILSPLLANIALSALDEHFAEAWEAMGDSHAREQRRRKGLANYRLVRYADDFVVLVAGDRAHAESLRTETAAVLAPIGLRLSERKTTIAHIDEGFVFLGFRIRRHKKRGTVKHHVYTYPSRAALMAVKVKVRALTEGSTEPVVSDPAAPAQPGAARLGQLLPARGIEQNLRLPRRVHLAAGLAMAVQQAPSKPPERARPALLRSDWRPVEDEVRLHNPARIAIVRYRYRHASIPTPWPTATTAGPTA